MGAVVSEGASRSQSRLANWALWRRHKLPLGASSFTNSSSQSAESERKRPIAGDFLEADLPVGDPEGRPPSSSRLHEATGGEARWVVSFTKLAAMASRAPSGSERLMAL
jgi:hypothetical protein